MLHLVEIMVDETEAPYPVAQYVVDIEPPVGEAERQQLQYRLDALLGEAPFEGVEELFTTIRPIEAIGSEENRDVLAKNIVDAALTALESEGIVLKKSGI